MHAADRPQTLGEEIANAISHGLGLALAIVALPTLVHAAALRGPAAGVVGAALFGSTMVLLYGVSTLYHALPRGSVKRFFQRLDHAAIFLFIAGSYMPFLLGVLRGGWGWSLLGVVSAAAVVGVVAKLLNRLKHPLWSTGLYVAMGWVALVAAVPLVQRMAPSGLAWLVAGGVSYTLGAVVFQFDNKLRYAHFAWHLFVIGGSACHFVAALHYSA
jgi:hemolysin III